MVSIHTVKDTLWLFELIYWRDCCVATGAWIVHGKGESIEFGQDGDVPIPADYDGDGKADIAIFRPLNGTVMIFGQEEEYKFDRPGLIPLAGGK